MCGVQLASQGDVVNWKSVLELLKVVVNQRKRTNRTKDLGNGYKVLKYPSRA